MKDGVCVKCGSGEVYFEQQPQRGVGVQITALYWQPATMFVCLDCGFLEFYATPGFDLNSAKERLQKVKQ